MQEEHKSLIFNEIIQKKEKEEKEREIFANARIKEKLKFISIIQICKYEYDYERFYYFHCSHPNNNWYFKKYCDDCNKNEVFRYITNLWNVNKIYWKEEKCFFCSLIVYEYSELDIIENEKIFIFKPIRKEDINILVINEEIEKSTKNQWIIRMTEKELKRIVCCSFCVFKLSRDIKDEPISIIYPNR